jgi:hypothetical protein
VTRAITASSALRDGIRYRQGKQRPRIDRGQVALYREAAERLGIELGTGL